MVFQSIEFIIFLPIVFGLYWFAFGRNLKAQNAFLVLASYVFYGWCDWKLLLLLAGISLSSYLCGLFIDKNRDNRKVAKAISAVNIIIGVGTLFLFKYYNFFAEEISRLLFGGGDKFVINLILPAGLSFYILRSLSYSIDVYLGKIEAEKDAIKVFAYISFFPQIMCGPIIRPGELIPQLSSRRIFKYDHGADGMRQILWGLFKKIVIADNCALYVNPIFADTGSYYSSTLVLAAVLYTIQIYADFSGYSDMAIGIGKLFGFTTSRNFNLPYFSRNIAEFWRRWHISLTSWFRDYVYIPLGGSRVPMWRVILNTFVIFLLSGLWHGANWTFLAWGAYHALLFVPLIITGANRRYKNDNIVAAGRKLPSVREFIEMLLTFVLAMFGWIIFKADSIGDAVTYIQSMFTSTLFTIPYFRAKAFIIPLVLSIICMLIAEWRTRESGEHTLYGLYRMPAVKRHIIYLMIILVIISLWGKNETFIYAQF